MSDHEMSMGKEIGMDGQVDEAGRGVRLEWEAIPNPPDFPEAGGVAFLRIFHPLEGYPIHLTARGVSALDAFIRLHEAIEVVKNVYGYVMIEPHTPREARPAQAAPAPVSAPTRTPPPPPPSAPPSPPVKTDILPGEEYEVIFMDKATVEMSGKQKVLKLKGGKLHNFGVVCWPEVASAVWNLDDMEVGETYDIGKVPTRVLKVDGKYKKVIGFENL